MRILTQHQTIIWVVWCVIIIAIMKTELTAQKHEFGFEFGTIVENQFKNDDVIYREFPANDRFVALVYGRRFESDGLFKLKLGLVRQTRTFEIWYPESEFFFRSRSEVAGTQHYFSLGYENSRVKLFEKIFIVPTIDLQILIENSPQKGGLEEFFENGETGNEEPSISTIMDSKFKGKLNPFLIPGIRLEAWRSLFFSVSYRQPLLSPFLESTITREYFGTEVSREKSSYSGGAFIVGGGIKLNFGK